MFDKKTNIDIKLNDKVLLGFLDSVKALLTIHLIGNESDIRKARMEFIRPLLEKEWNKTDAKEDERIQKALESKADKIRKSWEGYKEDLLIAEKQNKPTELIKAKLEVLDKLMEGIDV